MSLLNITGKSSVTPMQGVINTLRTNIAERGTGFASQDHTRQVLSMEGLNDAERGELNQHARTLHQIVSSAFDDMKSAGALGIEDITDVQYEAGVMVALAAADPITYAQAALNNRATASNGIPVISAESAGAAGRLDYRMDPALEAFDERTLTDMIPYSIAFNVSASRQDEFSETFYPTTVVSPEMGGVDITISRTLVFNQVHHKLTGERSDFHRKPLVEAAIDATILADESTSLIPYRLEDGSNAGNFLAGVSAVERRVGGVDVPTAPLKAGTDINLLGLSQHPELMGAGIMDHTDAVDTRVTLSNIYLKKDGVDQLIKMPTSRLPRASFVKTAEGNYREMGLQFRTSSLLVDGETTDLSGSELPFLSVVGDNNLSVRLAINIDGQLNTETGMVNVYSPGVRVAGVYDADGNELGTSTGSGKAVADALTGIQLVGYDLIAARTNSNRRTRGLLLTSDAMTERFTIPLAAPISAPSPTGTNRDTRDLDSLIAAARVRNSNNAVTSLLNYAETLRAYVNNVDARSHNGGLPEIEGMGRYVVRPFFEEKTIDLKKEINSIRSQDRAEDIASLLVNAIRDVSYRMYRDSGYQVALDASTVGSKEACLIVGTDAVIQRHLIVAGDTRTFGNGFKDHKIVTSWDSRVAGKIMLTFVRQGQEGVPDALSFGTHAWMPELASTMQVNRDGAMYTEAMVQPRTRHINNLPVMAIINVEGLEDVLAKSVSVPTEEQNTGTDSSEEEATGGDTSGETTNP